MPRQALAAALLLGFCLWLLSEPSTAAAKKKAPAKADPSAGAVDKALRAEVGGQVDRRGQLAEALKQHPDSAAARWQAGFVKEAESWRSFDEQQRNTAAAAVLGEYRRRRNEAPQSFPGQLDLANWCRKHGLKDQERSHLLVALSLTPEEEQSALLERLGFTQIGTQWISEDQQRDWKNAIRDTETSLKKWSSKLERIAQRLGGSKAQHAAALAELRAAADPSAIPAIELTLAGLEDETAKAAIETLANIDGPEASLALAKQGVFSPWPEARMMASRALKKRTFEDFVPAVIALLETPAEGRFQVLYDRSRGTLLYSYAMAAETENQFQVAAWNTVRQTFFVRVPRNSLLQPNPRPNSNAEIAQRLTGDSTRQAGDALYSRESQRDETNDRIQDINARAIAVLAEISELDSSDDVRKWWGWWHAYTDAPPAGTKPINVVSETDVAAPVLIPFVSSSCFAAGTPVWTETGIVPIETIKVGDRVLAQEIHSGELAYKPVLVTSVNPPKDLLTLRFGDETIVCTKGHRFWNSGSGWMKARDLAPQSMLHTVTGNTPVWSVKPAPAEKTYNLVVDGFHTYFVGKAGILCQDLRSSNGANFVVPGLHRANAVAQAAK